jgi:LAO/AO transport system kinase
VIDKLDLMHSKPKAHVIGITGSPGVGKSSLIDKLIQYIRKNNKSVGVIAVDPSSRETGGALLGDRTRFLLDPTDNNVFVRSMASKNYLGGISELTYPTMITMRSLFDYILVETVGVGQSEIFIKDITDTVVLCIQPGSGDNIQFMKSGIFEIPNIILVTKSDLRDLSNLTYSDLKGNENLFEYDEDNIFILKISSHKSFGFKNLFEVISKRWKMLKMQKRIFNQRRSQDIGWIERSIIDEFGQKGKEQIKDLIKYNSNPFKTLNKLRNHLAKN